ncbi:MAG: dihydroorotase [Spirochaetae bacterium HGW-Spirochaetae-3]|jgi:allantoinase|nr:MAG: dihydroorotase [Spirochaetae bacterium HGW-Spirochaetae-3]
MILKNGLCALPGADALERRDIRIDGETIVGIAASIEPTAGEDVFDASGLEVFPGAIDPHVHFDEPGFTHREDFLHGTMAAARGGVTTVIDMPCTSLPPVTTAANLREKLAAMGGRGVVDYALYGGVSGHRIEEALASDMEALAPDVVGFKCYFVSGMDTFTAVDHYGFGGAVAKAAGLGRPLLLHAEDPGVVLPATAAMKARSIAAGRAPSWDDYVDSRPESAETVAVASAIALAKGREGALHVVHVGTADAAEAVAAAGATCETCPHYLAFGREDFADKGSSLKTAPPVKSREQSARLWRLLESGAIVYVASDHAPAPESEKRTGSVWTDYGGIPGTGTLFPYLYSEGYRAGRLSLRSFLRATSGGAAARFGLSGRKGAIAVGMDADLVLVDPSGVYEVRGSELLSKGTITPFEGMRLAGRIRETMVRGRTVWNAASGIIAEAGYGKHLRWGYR